MNSSKIKKMKKFAFLFLITFAPVICMASVDSSLDNIYNKVVGTYLPICAVLGLVFAGFSFVMGHEKARHHLVLAIIGAVVGFGANSIITLIRSLVQ